MITIKYKVLVRFNLYCGPLNKNGKIISLEPLKDIGKKSGSVVKFPQGAKYYDYISEDDVIFIDKITRTLIERNWIEPFSASDHKETQKYIARG